MQLVLGLVSLVQLCGIGIPIIFRYNQLPSGKDLRTPPVENGRCPGYMVYLSMHPWYGVQYLWVYPEGPDGYLGYIIHKSIIYGFLMDLDLQIQNPMDFLWIWILQSPE